MVTSKPPFEPTASPRNPFAKQALRFKAQRKGVEVKKATKIAGKRIGGAQRAEQARQQKRRDSRH